MPNGLHWVALAKAEVGIAADRLTHPGTAWLSDPPMLGTDEGCAAREATGAVEPAPGFGASAVLPSPPKPWRTTMRRLAKARSSSRSSLVGGGSRGGAGRQAARDAGMGRGCRDGGRAVSLRIVGFYKIVSAACSIVPGRNQSRNRRCSFPRDCPECLALLTFPSHRIPV